MLDRPVSLCVINICFILLIIRVFNNVINKNLAEMLRCTKCFHLLLKTEEIEIFLSFHSDVKECGSYVGNANCFLNSDRECIRREKPVISSIK